MILSKAIEGYLLDAAVSLSPKSVRLYRLYLGLFTGYCGDPEVESINAQQLKTYMVFLQTSYVPHRPSGSKEKLSPSAVDNHWKCLRSFFRWAEGAIELKRPDLTLPRPKFQLPQLVPFSQDDVNKLLKAIEWSREIHNETGKVFRRHRPRWRRDKALLLLFLDTGLRVGEVSRLKTQDLHLDTGEILVAPFSSGIKSRPRFVYLGSSAKRAVWAYLAENPHQPDASLFSPSTNRLRLIVKEWGNLAGVPDCHPHRFRHTFAIEYLRNGGDIMTLQRILGHTSLDMVQHYLHLVQSDVERVHRLASPSDHWKL